MKKLLTLFAAMLFCIAGFAQHKACCSKKETATRRFALLSDNKNFRDAHKLPKKLHYHAEGEMIAFKTADGKTASAYMLKAKKPTNNYLLVIHEWWGLNDYVKRESDKLYKDLGNVNILAVDLYDGVVATTREQAGQLTQTTKEERIIAILNGAVKYAGANAKITPLGWCFGGAWSLQAGIMLGKRANGIVMFYGMPEQDINRIKKIQSPVLGIFANKDAWITPKVVETFARDMKVNGKKLVLHQYNAGHAFANPSNDAFDNEAAADAYKHVLTFLRTRLK